MDWTESHGRLLQRAFEKVLGRATPGAMAFVRCLTADVVRALAQESAFAPPEWLVARVADVEDPALRTITADRAVEMREAKDGASLLLVDTNEAGAGMDGIYSAAREVDESSLFDEAIALAGREITQRLSRSSRLYAERAVKKARGHGGHFSISRWAEFDFFCQIVANRSHPGEHLHLIGLWPIAEPGGSNALDESDGLDVSRIFLDRLLGPAVSGITPARRIEALRLLQPTKEQKRDLESFLRSAATKSLLSALGELADKRHLWVNSLQREGAAHSILGIDLLSWRTNVGKVAKWSGLIEDGEPDNPPILIIRPDAERTGDYSKLEVKWKARPDNLEKGAVEYRVAIVTDLDEELASREISHSAKKEEKCAFSNDDFTTLSDDALISARVVVSVIGAESVEPQKTEEFIIRFGQPPERERGGVGIIVRTFSEGLIELESRESVSALASATVILPADAKGFVLFRLAQRGKSFRVFRPPLIRDIESQWVERSGPIGRWTVRVRASGARASQAEFVPLARPEPASPSNQQALWDRVASASRRMAAERFAASGGGVGQVYDQASKAFETVVKEYLLGWTALIEEGNPLFALANTVEVQSLSGRTIGLVVLPSHPLRVAWHVGYDNLLLHAAFDQKARAKDIRKEFTILDGAMYPAFLPGLENGSSFVFADTLGFHAVGMVPDFDKEPKAAVAILARALGESDTAETAPTVGKQSAVVLGNEISKYLECHNTSRLLHVHALRPGDGLTVARSLGKVHEKYRENLSHDDEDDGARTSPSFVLELYPSAEQRGIAGRFIAEAREKRRSGAGVLSQEDQWMLDSMSLPGGVNLPRLRWARKREQDPKTPAHIAVAFDTFESRVVSEDGKLPTRPLFAYGLQSFFDRDYSSAPTPAWRSTIPPVGEGEKHPSDRAHTDRLARLHDSIQRAVSRSVRGSGNMPALRTDISPDKEQSLREIHRLCDWVITLDRNAGIEYFDSPKDNKEIYDSYVIDCVPEREDLGCLQLITSTSNLEEVRNLLDGALDQMGLSRSRRNAEFLMEQLKALSGRLAIRLTGEKAPTSELVALALCHANCWAKGSDDCWVSFETGFLIPVDDVRDLLPPLNRQEDDISTRETRPDLIHVSVVPRKGLLFRFIEVKYRRHLRTARDPAELQALRAQVGGLRARWDRWYGVAEAASSFRTVRRAKLARVLRFYADKARRHYLHDEHHAVITGEINRMVEKGADYQFASAAQSDRGWIFCPEFSGERALEISPADWETRVFLFGPTLLPDSDFRASFDPVVPNGDGGDISQPTLESPAPDSVADISAMLSAVPRTADTGETGQTVLESPSIVLGTDVLTGADACWSLTIKGNPHLLVAGLPGMGKTTCLLNICSQMLASSIRPIIFSYHEDIDAKLAKTVGSVRFVDFQGLGFNPLRIISNESATAYLDVAGSLRDIFIAIFPELGDIQGERIRKAIKDSFVELGWGTPDAIIRELPEPPFGRFVELLREDKKPDRGLRTLLSRLEELADYGFFDPGESRESLWEGEQPIVIRVHATQNDNLQKAFAFLVFYGLYKDMFRRGIQERISHAIVFDEAHRAAGLKLISTMAKECRKYGFSLVVASQEARDFNPSLFSAIANYLILRLTEADAKELVRNVATAQQERVLIDKIKQMDRFRGLFFGEGKAKPAIIGLRA